MIWCDFESRSACDLKIAGVYNYAQSLSTEVLCMAYAYDDGEVQMWTGGPLPDFTGHQIRAHNAAFERLIFWYVLQQDYPLEQFYCTAAQARANCAPGSLEDAGRFAGASMRKDHRGGHLVRQCCIPPYNTALLPELFDYCAQDVRAMRAISQGMRGLSDDELLDYHVNERINDRGVLVDVELARSAVRYASAELIEIQDTVAKVTQGAVTSVRSPKMRQWVQDRVSPEQLALMTVEDKISIDKTVRANLLACDDLDPDVREVVQSADDLWASSVAKFARMAALADEEDHRVRGAFVFNGGAATGRLSSYGLQVHNFTRKCAKEPQQVRDSMVADAPIVPAFGKRVTDVLKSMLRPALIPAHGKQFVVASGHGVLEESAGLSPPHGALPAVQSDQTVRN
jgi:DNA polymerase